MSSSSSSSSPSMPENNTTNPTGKTSLDKANEIFAATRTYTIDDKLSIDHLKSSTNLLVQCTRDKEFINGLGNLKLFEFNQTGHQLAWNSFFGSLSQFSCFTEKNIAVIQGALALISDINYELSPREFIKQTAIAELRTRLHKYYIAFLDIVGPFFNRVLNADKGSRSGNMLLTWIGLFLKTNLPLTHEYISPETSRTLANTGIMVSMGMVWIANAYHAISHDNALDLCDIPAAMTINNLPILKTLTFFGAPSSACVEQHRDRLMKLIETDPDATVRTSRGLMALTGMYFLKFYNYLSGRLVDMNVHTNQGKIRAVIFKTMFRDPLRVEKCFDFCAFVCKIILNDLDKRPELIGFYPEMIIDELLIFFMFIVNHLSDFPRIQKSTEWSSVVSTFVRLLDTPINAHLRRTILTFFCKCIKNRRLPGWDNLFDNEPQLMHFALKNIDNSYFNFRFDLCYVFGYLWRLPCNAKLHNSIATSKEFPYFLQMILDDAVNSAQRIYDHIFNVAATVTSNADPSVAAATRYFNIISTHYVYLLEEITKSYRSRFFIKPHSDILAVKFATLISYYLRVLTNKSNIEKFANVSYNYRSTLVLILMLLSNMSSFALARELCQQEDVENLVRAFSLKLKTRDREQTIILTQFVSKLRHLQSLYDDYATTLPEHYFDPISSAIMRNPVKLPVSKLIVDYSTIMIQLQKAPIDPYTRTPLTQQDLIPCGRLKSEFDHFWNKLEREISSEY